MDSTTKNLIDKKRRGAKKRVEMQGSTGMLGNRKASQPDFYQNRGEVENDSDYDSFRSRTLSNISAPGRNRVSPTFNPNSDEFNFEQWTPNNCAVQTNSCHMNEIMNRTDRICLDTTDTQYVQITPMSRNNQQPVYSDIPQQIMPNFQMKQDDIKPQLQQNYYQELKSVRGDQQIHNPLLRNKQFSQPQQGSTYVFGSNRVANNPNWGMNNNQQMNCFVQQPEFQKQQFVSQSPNMIGQQQFIQISSDQSLPKDLENLNTFVPPECDLNGIEEIIREELSPSNSKFGF